MSNIANLGTFPHTIGNLDDRPNLTAAQMKAALEQDVMTLWGRLAEAIPMINDILPASRLVDIVNSSSTDSGVPTAKAVYDAIANASLGGNAQQIIDDWLDAHPEATTTVTDGSITNAKLAYTFATPGVASAYVSGTEYPAGSYVFHGGTLYTNPEDVSDSVWTAAHWVSVALGNEVTYLKSAVNTRVPITATGTAQAFSGDFDDLTDNQIIGFTNTTGATHSPVNGIGGTLVVLRGRTDYDVTATQLFIPQNGATLYYRILGGGGWTAWNNLPNEDYYSSISQFQKIGVIGDSYASGWVYPGGQGQNNYQLSWGQNIARRNGITCINISSGGLTTKSWLTHERGLAYLNSNPAQNLYFVCLGLNDQGAINAGTYTLGNSTDFANKTDTFYGNYAKIIDAVKTKAPNAKIVLCTVSEGDKTTFKQVSDAIVEIGTLASLPVIDITDDPFTTSSFFNNSMVASHPTAASYSGYAMMIERMFSKCCVKNYAYFMDYYGD